MADQIKSLLADVTKLKLAITEFKPFFKEYKKCDVYNTTIDEPFHKIWLKTPKLKTLTSPVFKEVLNRDIRIEISLTTTESRKFIDDIEKIENTISSNLNIPYRSSIKKINDHSAVITLKTPVENNKYCFKCFGLNNEKMDFKDVIRNDKITGYIELTNVWVKDDELGFNWGVLQVKMYQTFDFSKCLFGDENHTEEIVIKPKIITPLVQKPIDNQIKPPIMTGFIPTKEALLEMRQKLKSGFVPKTTSETSEIKNKQVKNITNLNIEEMLLEAELEGAEINEMMIWTDKKYDKFTKLITKN